MSDSEVRGAEAPQVGAGPSPDEAPRGAATGPEPERRGQVPAESPAARPGLLFLFVVAGVSLALDAGTKLWAVAALDGPPGRRREIEVIADHLYFSLAYNEGGAFGMFARQDPWVRRPFFILVSLAAGWFILTLYRRVRPEQWALRWGLPFVFSGAVGNFIDRVIRGSVVDFIDYKAAWVRSMFDALNGLGLRFHSTDHWPTFNVADIAICVGVGLMAVDMLVSRRGTEDAQPTGAEPPDADELDDLDDEPSPPRAKASSL